MSKTLAHTATAAELHAGGILISTGQAAEMTWRPQPTDTDTMSSDTDRDEQPERNRNRSSAATRVMHALAEARKARHHPDCHCRMWQRTACNAADALWTRATNRELEQMTRDTEQTEETAV